MPSSIFAAVEMAPRDPILGLNESFNADTRSTKVNLGVGVVKIAEDARVKAALPRGYQPIEGAPAYNQAVQNLLFGSGSPLLANGQVITAQTLGGTGALKVGADYLKRLNPDSKVYISDPSWENHRALFESAGFVVENYPYYDAATRGVNFEGMKTCLKDLDAGSVIVLHACCHNPKSARNAAWCPSSTWPTRDLRMASMPIPSLFALFRGPACNSSLPVRSPRTSHSMANGLAPCPSSPPARKNQLA